MKNLTDKVIAVTGAGSGIGRELAIQLAKKNAILALNDFNAESLAETVALINVPKDRVSQHVFDVGELENVQNFVTDILEIHGHLDGIINNAGTTLGKIKVIDMQYDEVDWLLKINLWGVIYGTKETLPHLINRPESFIVNISSVFGIMGVPTQSAYCISKFAVRGFTESLRMEVAKYTNLQIIQVHPGGIDTNIITNSKIRTETAKEKLTAQFKKGAMTSASDAAKTIINGIQNKKTRVLIGRDAKWIDFIVRLFPTTYAKYLAKPPKKK
jgi:NADP-dependent 3-hydroxy acid dehydrogenase YdfG